LDEINISHWALNWLIDKGLNETSAEYLTLAIDLLLVFIISLLADYFARRVILRVVTRYVKHSKNQYDDVLLEKRVFKSVAHLLPTFVIYYSLPWLFDEINTTVLLLQKLVVIYGLIIVIGVIHKFLKALEMMALNSKRMQGKPISSYIQLILIIVYIAGGVFIIATLVDKSAVAILTTFGAATAVILLVFRDTILGLVASIQIAGNDMVRIGDWVSMPKYGADGDVLEINLTTVKVRNWDKTISTVPTYAFISDSFVNWRGMTNLGVRRIKRSINIDLQTVKFISPEMQGRFMKFERVQNYISERQKEIDLANAKGKNDKSISLNGRQMTNLGLFRRYAETYLSEHPNVAKNETLMVRQLQPTEMGIPLEIYCFSNDIEWLKYESIQSDIMDHLLSATSYFELAVFQRPSGNNFSNSFKD
jgi:miniconductance mechanosensitive channel